MLIANFGKYANGGIFVAVKNTTGRNIKEGESIDIPSEGIEMGNHDFLLAATTKANENIHHGSFGLLRLRTLVLR